MMLCFGKRSSQVNQRRSTESTPELEDLLRRFTSFLMDRLGAVGLQQKTKVEAGLLLKED